VSAATAPPAPSAPSARAARRPARPPAPTAATVASRVLSLICACVLLMVVNLVVVSSVQEYFAQNGLYGQLRLTLAEGATPVGPVTNTGTAVANGTPVAVLNAPVVGLRRAVIVQGSGGAQTMVGIGHVPDTVMPCQSGVAALMARSGAYGGYALGGKWKGLRPGDEFTVTMGQGTCTYRVEDQRLPGQLAPAPPAGDGGAIVLITAAGSPFMPTAVLRVDATLVGKAYTPPAAAIPPADVPASENPMGTDSSHLFAVILLLQVLLAAAIAAAWTWQRWGRRETWIVAIPVLVTFALLAADNLNLLLPNLL
jgi:sortase A